MEYKAAVFLGNSSMETRMYETRQPGAGEVLIRNRAAGVCGTDVHIYMGEKGASPVKPPVVLGHEYSGEIVAVGDGVKGLQPGDHVTVDPNIYCGECYPCRIGKKQHCEHMDAIGVGRDGGFAEYSLVDAKQCILLDPALPLEAGAMAEPLACCLHGIDRAKIRPGDHVYIIGGGTIGLLMVQLAKLSGAATITLSEPVALRREIGLKLGATWALAPQDGVFAPEAPSQVKDRGADVVIECVGNSRAVERAFEAAARGATILLFSVPKPDAVFPVHLYDIFQKELTILGSFVNPDTHQRAVELLNSGRIRTDLLITHRFPVEQCEEAIKMQMSSESIKVLVTP